MSNYPDKGKAFIEEIFASALILSPPSIGFLLLLGIGQEVPIEQPLLTLNIKIFSCDTAAIAVLVHIFNLIQ